MPGKTNIDSPGRFDGFRADINGLRGVAILLVLLFHFNAPKAAGGFIGVDVFFVISGYLMTAIVLRGLTTGQFSLAGFYRARARRIMPPLALMILSSLTLGFFLVDPILYAAMARQALSSLLFVSNIDYFLTTSYFGNAADTIWFLHSWSLSAEWQLYLAYPLFLALLLRIAPGRLAYALLATAALIYAASLALLFTGGGRMMSGLFYMSPFRAPEMIIGGLAYICRVQAPARVGRVSAIFGLALILCTAAIAGPQTAWPAPLSLTAVAGAALILVVDTGKAGLLGLAPLQLIGRWSYSIYLWHWPLIVALNYAGYTDARSYALAFIASIIVGALSHRFVERPLGNHPDAGVTAIVRQNGVSVAVFGLTTVVATAVLMLNGLPSRAPAAAQRYIADAEKAKEEWAFPERCDKVLCTVGPGRANTLIVGDSHGEMWYPAFDMFARKERRAMDIFVAAGCLPVPGVSKLTNPGCGDFSRRVGQEVLSPRYQRIVIVTSWYEWFDPTKASGVCVQNQRACDPISEPAARAAARVHLVRFVSDLLDRGKEVILFRQSPMVSFDVPDRIAQSRFQGEDAGDLAAFPAADLVTDPDGVDATLELLRKRGARLIAPSASLCVGGRCRLVDERGFSLYRDNNHFRSDTVRSFAALDNLLR